MISAKNIPAIRPREFRLAMIAGGLIGCWAVVSLIVQPLWDRNSDLRLEVETRTERLSAVSRLLEQAPKIESNYQQIIPYLQGNDDTSQGAFLNELEALSRDSQVRMNMKPRAVKQEGKLSRYEVELDLEGSQEQVMVFLDSILKLPKLITVERLRLTSAPTREALLRANLVIQKLSLQ